MAEPRMLRVLRTAKGLNLQQLAKATGRTVSYWSLIERGRKSPKISDIEQLAHAYKINTKDLFLLLIGETGITISANKTVVGNSPEA